jgi:hypothetical protein
VNYLKCATSRGRRRLNCRDRVLNRIVVGEGDARSRATADAPDGVAARPDEHEVRAQALCSTSGSCAADPTATMAMIAPTPMVIPSVVSELRSLLTCRARAALRVFSSNIGAAAPARAGPLAIRPMSRGPIRPFYEIVFIGHQS